MFFRLMNICLYSCLFFCGYYHVGYLVLIISSMLVNYLVAVFMQRQLGKREKLSKALLTLGVLIAFPQLVAAPIEQYKEMIPQFADKNRIGITLTKEVFL